MVAVFDGHRAVSYKNGRCPPNVYVHPHTDLQTRFRTEREIKEGASGDVCLCLARGGGQQVIVDAAALLLRYLST